MIDNWIFFNKIWIIELCISSFFFTWRPVCKDLCSFKYKLNAVRFLNIFVERRTFFLSYFFKLTIVYGIAVKSSPRYR